jgi:hypothetical protein
MSLLKSTRRQMARIMPALFRGLASTWRLKITGTVPASPGVVAFWHGEMLPVLSYFSHQDHFALASLSRDGSLISRLLESWGYTMVRGSSSKGGREALFQLVPAARERLIMITPDGPRGPRHEMKAGAILTARKAEVPLTLCRVECRHALHGTNWDRFLIPLPFALVHVEFISFPLPPVSERVSSKELVAQVNAVFAAPR